MSKSVEPVVMATVMAVVQPSGKGGGGLVDRPRDLDDARKSGLLTICTIFLEWVEAFESVTRFFSVAAMCLVRRPSKS